MDNFSISVIFLSILIGGVIGFVLHSCFKRTVNHKSVKITNTISTKKDKQFIGHVNLASLLNTEKAHLQKTKNQRESSLGKNDTEEKAKFTEYKLADQRSHMISKTLDTDRINSSLGELHGKLATAQLKAKTRQIAEEMSQEEKDYEAKMKKAQMESILNLMMQNQEKFGMSSDDIKEQMNLYNF